MYRLLLASALTRGSRPGRLFWIAITFAAGVVGCDVAYRHAVLDAAAAVTASPDTEAAAMASHPGNRNWMLAADAFDARWWILHAEDAARDGRWRVRMTTRDNAPQGREVHWSSSLHWLVRIMAGARRLATRDPIEASFAWTARWAGPFQWLLGAGVLGALAVRGFGWNLGGFLVLCMACCTPVAELFRAGEVDHHGIVALFLLGMLLSLLSGLMRASPANRRWFSLSGFFGAAAMWVSAPTTILALVACGLGALASLAIGGRPSAFAADAAGGWRRWGIAGAAGCMFFYLLEYFPGAMGWRLEVNHPVYALAWLGASELLSRLYCKCGNKEGAFLHGGRKAWPMVALASGAIVLPALLTGYCGASVFALRDPFLRLVHARIILEDLPLWTNLKGGAGWGLWVAYILWPVAGLTAASLTRSVPVPRQRRLAVVFCAVAALFLECVAIVQMRWIGIASSFWIASLAVSIATRASAERPRPPSRGVQALSLLLFAVMASAQVKTFARLRDLREMRDHIPAAYIFPTLLRDIAHRIQSHYESQRLLVLSDPTSSTDLAFFGNLPVMGTLYWENGRGLHRACEILASATEAVAKSRIQAEGVTHIVLPNWDPMADPRICAELLSASESPATDTGEFFAHLLSDKSFPDWLRPFAFPVHPGLVASPGQDIMILEVNFAQSPAAAALSRGYYYAESRLWPSAIREFERVLEWEPGHAEALRWLAEVKQIAGSQR